MDTHTTAGHPGDRGLVTRIVRRDEAALAALYDRFGGPVYIIALRATHDEAAAAALVQDVFRTVWLMPATLQPGCDVATWIVGIARRRARDAAQAPRDDG